MRRRRKRSKPSVVGRLQLRFENLADLIRLKKYYVVYVAAGIAAGLLMRPVVLFLAAFSMPEDWRDSRATEAFSWQTFWEPFVAAARTLGRWLFQATVGTVVWVYEVVADFILYHRSAAVMAVLGSAVGFMMARRRHNRDRSAGRRR